MSGSGSPLHLSCLPRLSAFAQIRVDEVLIRNAVLFGALKYLIVSSSNRIVSCVFALLRYGLLTDLEKS